MGKIRKHFKMPSAEYFTQSIKRLTSSSKGALTSSYSFKERGTRFFLQVIIIIIIIVMSLNVRNIPAHISTQRRLKSACASALSD